MVQCSDIVVIYFGEIAVTIFQQRPADVSFENFLVGELIAQARELIHRHIEWLQNVFQRPTQIFPRKQTV
jgi:hypothetical protein